MFLNFFHLFLALVTASDSCRIEDDASDIMKVVNTAIVQNQSADQKSDAFMTPAYPVAPRDIRVSGFVGAEVFFEISDPAGVHRQKALALKIGQSYFGLELKNADGNRAYMVAPDGGIVKIGTNTPERVQIYSSPSGLNASMVSKILAGDDSWLVDDWKHFSETRESNLSLGGSWRYPGIREKLLLVQHRNDRSFESFVFFKKRESKDKEVEDSELGAVDITEFYAKSGYGWKNPDGRLYMSSEYVDCRDEVHRRMPLWDLAGVESDYPPESRDTLYEDEAIQYRRCRVTEGVEGVCCGKTCVPKGDFKSESDNPCSAGRDECGYRNFFADSAFDGRHCELRSDDGEPQKKREGVCYRGTCFENGMYQDVFPCASAISSSDEKGPDNEENDSSTAIEDDSSPALQINARDDPGFKFVKDGTPCGWGKVCKNRKCIDYKAEDWEAFFDEIAAEISAKARDDLESEFISNQIGVSGVCTVSQNGVKTFFANGSTCRIDREHLGNCWQGDCFRCDPQSPQKLVGAAACPPSISWPGRKGIRLSCTDPEICSYF